VKKVFLLFIISILTLAALGCGQSAPAAPKRDTSSLGKALVGEWKLQGTPGSHDFLIGLTFNPDGAYQEVKKDGTINNAKYTIAEENPQTMIVSVLCTGDSIMAGAINITGVYPKYKLAADYQTMQEAWATGSTEGGRTFSYVGPPN